MLISPAGRFIFIHVPKTAGMSMQRYFMGKCGDLKDRVDGVRIGDVDLEDFHHPFARDVRDVLGAAVWNSYYRFAFVRNPWARMVSWYEMAVQQIADTPSLRRIKAVSFDAFLDLEDLAHVWNNQLDYLTDADGRIIVDFVGRYENLKPDFAAVCARLGWQPWLKHMNRSSHGPYREYYDARSRAIVAERFQRDITAFSYTF